MTAIRGFAALWVVGHHLVPAWYPNATGWVPTLFLTGYAAVDVFFVLSGFILATVYRDLATSETPMFLLKRLCRVYPLHLCIMAALVAAALVSSLSGGSVSKPWGQLPWVGLMLQSYVLSETTWNPPSWSVGVELLCYGLLPAAVWLLRRIPKRLLAGLAFLLACAEFEFLQSVGGAVVGLGAILRGIAGFSLGAALGSFAQSFGRLPERLASAGQLSALAGLAVAIVLCRSAPIAPLSGLLIFSLACETGLISRALGGRWCVRLGTISYSIYLLHAPLLFAFGKISAGWNGAARVPIFLLLLLASSEITYRLIETPGRRLPRTLMQRLAAHRPALSAEGNSNL